MNLQVLFALIFLKIVCVIGYDICEERFTLKTDLAQVDCPTNTYYKPNLLNKCLPNCVHVDGYQSFCENDETCPPGYKCSENNECLPNTESCLIYHTNFSEADKNYYEAVWKPTCLKDGTWAPKQCKGEDANGRCFCYDTVGNKIFGHAWSNRAQNMTCACSRKRSELQEDPTKWYITIHCDEQGNYEKLQCTSGQCWCAEPETGDVESHVVPETMMKHLPCYNAEKVGSQYLRQCESQSLAHSEITYELNTHGTKYVNFPHLLCDLDGSYGKFKIVNSITYCTWKDNSNIASFQQGTTEKEKINCNCAYDMKLFESIGQSQNLKCSPNGNYDPVQNLNGLYFCVDSDGFPKSDFTKEPLTVSDCEEKK